jgi:hypothetical protein
MSATGIVERARSQATDLAAARERLRAAGSLEAAPWPPEPRRSPGLDLVASAAPPRGRGSEVAVLDDVLDRVAAGRPALMRNAPAARPGRGR